MALPLEKKQIIVEDSTGKKEYVPVLHPKHLEKMLFVTYKAPPMDMTDRGQYEEWMERLKFIAEDLHCLLQLPHEKFWCQAVFNDTLQKLLDAYLRFAPRSFDILYNLAEKDCERHLEVSRLIFMTCLRMATHKESKDDFITPSVFGDILYENFIFDIPKILDLCILYAQGNESLLTKMIDNIFTQQPKYLDDLRATVPTIIQVLDTMKDMNGVGSPSKPTKLNHSGNTESRLVTMTIKEYQDVIFYLADTALTISNFLDIYPPAAVIFHEAAFEQRLASFYETVIPEIQSALKTQQFETSSHKRMIKLKIHQTKKYLQKIFYTLISYNCIQPILNHSDDNKSVSGCVEDFLHTMSAVLGERRFLADYEARYSFQEYADIICQTSCDVDDTQVRYIQDAVNNAYATFGKRKKPTGAMSSGGRTSPDGSHSPLIDCSVGGDAVGAGPMNERLTPGCGMDEYAAAYSQDMYQIEDYDIEGATAPRPNQVELKSLVCSVQDLLPSLGEGFIEILLEEFGYSFEKAIDAVLTDNLPPSLKDIDFNTQSLERDSPDEHSLSLVDQRRNIFDNDEFDVFRRTDVDMSRVHRGKRQDDAGIDDKSTIKQLKATYDAYGSRDHGSSSMYDTKLDYDYDDEYDDTYDTHNIGARDDDSADELTARRPFVVPRALQKRTPAPIVKQEESEESSEEEPGRINNNFVRDPAKLREKAEARRRDHGWGSSGGSHGNTGARPKHDVVGKPKGQGQEGDVVKNRKFKEKNKSARSNHNRKSMADRKKNKGMMPI